MRVIVVLGIFGCGGGGRAPGDSLLAGLRANEQMELCGLIVEHVGEGRTVRCGPDTSVDVQAFTIEDCLAQLFIQTVHSRGR